MEKYNVPLTGIANITVTVTTDETDPDKIAALAIEKAEAEAIGLCRQCSSALNSSLDVGDEWRAVIDDRTKASEVIKISN
ncbi:hypothetical protein ACIHJG_35825 [Streptomyces sp. NPDC052415]|uniref:hypothetical protein n=1 Tax=Streptomyces sp. NPDC052415 TaxID=3365690 RepID=UPI0037CEADC9